MHNELTRQDIRKMEEEIEYRKLVVRREALEDVKTARAHGDLSENFESSSAFPSGDSVLISPSRELPRTVVTSLYDEA